MGSSWIAGLAMTAFVTRGPSMIGPMAVRRRTGRSAGDGQRRGPGEHEHGAREPERDLAPAGGLAQPHARPTPRSGATADSRSGATIASGARLSANRTNAYAAERQQPADDRPRGRSSGSSGARGRAAGDPRPATHATMSQPDRAHRPQDPGVEPRRRRLDADPVEGRVRRRSSRPVRSAKPAAIRSSRAVALPSSRHGRWTTSSPPTRSADAEPRRRREPLAEDRRRRRPRRAAAPCRGRAGTRPTGRPAGRPRRGTRSTRPPPRRRPVPMSHASGGIDGCPNASQPSATSRDEDQARGHDHPAVAVRSGSPAVLSRMFHAACRTAAIAIEDEGERNPRRESRSWRGRPDGTAPGGCAAPATGQRSALDVAPAHRPRSPSSEPADREHGDAGPCPASPTGRPSGGRGGAVSASWWIQSGSSSAGTTRSMRNVSDDEQRDDLAGERGP